MEVSTYRDAMEWILEKTDVKIERVGDVPYAVGAGRAVPLQRPQEPHCAEPIRLATLKGFARFVAVNIDGLDLPKHVITVQHADVRLHSSLNSYRKREVIAHASIESNWASFIGSGWMNMQEMATHLGALCGRKGDRDAVIDLLSSVSITEGQKRERNGLGYDLSNDLKIDGADWNEVADPVFELAPHRSFPEAFGRDGQVLSRFLLDVDISGSNDSNKKIPFARLRSAGGGLWKVVAASKVAERLEEEFADVAEELEVGRNTLPMISH